MPAMWVAGQVSVLASRLLLLVQEAWASGGLKQLAGRPVVESKDRVSKVLLPNPPHRPGSEETDVILVIQDQAPRA